MALAPAVDGQMPAGTGRAVGRNHGRRCGDIRSRESDAHLAAGAARRGAVRRDRARIQNVAGLDIDLTADPPIGVELAAVDEHVCG